MHVLGGNEKLVYVAQNSCNLSYLIRQRQEHQKMCSLRFSLHKFVHIKFFWTLFKNVHCQGSCSLRWCISRPYSSHFALHSFHIESNLSAEIDSLVQYARVLSRWKVYCLAQCFGTVVAFTPIPLLTLYRIVQLLQATPYAKQDWARVRRRSSSQQREQTQ